MTEGDITQALRSAVADGRLEAMPDQPAASLLAALEAHSLRVGGGSSVHLQLAFWRLWRLWRLSHPHQPNITIKHHH
jgi:hypothetical protein